MISYEFYIKHIEEYFNLVYNTYPTFAPPVLVIYYQNMDVAFDNQSNAGYSNPAISLSPNRFKKIIGVPIVISDLQAHTTQKDVSGYIESTNPFTFVMFGRVGIKPRPDDYISFSLLSNVATTNSLCIIQSVEPAMLFTSSPYNDTYQAFKVTAQIVAPTTINIESKVIEESVYIDKWNKFLSSTNALLYVNTYDLYKRLENYFQEITHPISNCLTHLSYSYYNATKCFLQMVNENSLFYSPSLSTYLWNINNVTLPETIFEAMLLNNNNNTYVNTFELVDNVISDQISAQTSDFLFRAYKRFVYVGSSTGTVNFYETFYPENSSLAQTICNQIINQMNTNTYELINSTHSLATIHNKYVQWKTTNYVHWNENWTNMFEALLLYKYTSEILWTLKTL